MEDDALREIAEELKALRQVITLIWERLDQRFPPEVEVAAAKVRREYRETVDWLHRHDNTTVQPRFVARQPIDPDRPR